MPRPKPLIDSTAEVREPTTEDLNKFRPAVDVLPASLRRKLGIRGPQRAPTSERITIRLSQDVVQRFRATHQAWQTTVDAVLRDWLE